MPRPINLITLLVALLVCGVQAQPGTRGQSGVRNGNADIILYNGGMDYLGGKAFGRQEIIFPNSGQPYVRQEYIDATAIYEGGIAFDAAGTTVEIGKYSGTGHVLCEGDWRTYERRAVLSNRDGFFVLASVTAEESANPNNEDAQVICSVPNAEGGFFSIVVGTSSVTHAGGSLRCASGIVRQQLTGVPPSLQDDYLSFGTSFVVSQEITEGYGTERIGTISIPKDC